MRSSLNQGPFSILVTKIVCYPDKKDSRATHMRPAEAALNLSHGLVLEPESGIGAGIVSNMIPYGSQCLYTPKLTCAKALF